MTAVLAAAAAAGGLLLDDAYRDNTWVRAAWRGNDLVTLALAAPLLAACLVRARSGSVRALLGWVGLLAYMLYGYAFYLFGAAFNRFFLLYAAVVACALYALIFALPRLDAAAIARRVRAWVPVRWIAGYMAVVGLGLGAAWVALSLGFVFTGRVPAPVEASGHPTAIVFALDLSLLVPAFLLGAVWLWRRDARGYVLAVMMNVKGATYTLALAAASVAAARAGVPGAAGEIPLWSGLTVASSLAAGLLLAGVGPGPISEVEP